METKERILGLLLGGGKTALSLAKELGIRESAVRAHLESLRGEGAVTSVFERLGRGRPKKVYALTEKGLERFPRRYDEVLELLLREIEREDPEKATQYMRSVAKLLAQTTLAGRIPPLSVQEAATLLDSLGFHTTYSVTDGQAAISSANCILRRVALKHPALVCTGLHTWLIEDLTGRTGVKLGRCMAYGDEVCVHIIPTTSEAPRQTVGVP
ncbi:MAG: ArsR family transcriptional regulator [Thermoprotei archaeon]